MTPLDALQKEYSLIDSSFLQFCTSNGIYTVEDFATHDLYSLAAFADQHYASDKLKQGITQILSFIDSRCRPWLNGLELLNDVEQKKHILSTGCERIDALLQGGFREGHVTELVGPPSSGKTQVCLQTSSNVAKQYPGRIIYIDSGNSFSPKRIAQFLNQPSDTADIKAVRALQQTMNKILHHSIFDIFSLLDFLHQLLDNLRSQMGYRVRMLIIDSLSSLIAPILGGGGTHGHALMASTGFLLKELAHEHNLSVVVTNHMVAGEDGVLKPALGESWKCIPHVRIMLSQCHGTIISKISLLKHPYLVRIFTHVVFICTLDLFMHK